MTEKLKVTFMEQENNIFGFRIDGHANYDDYGKDIVCAAISVLAQTTIASIEQLSQLKKSSYDYSINPGDTFIQVNPEDINQVVSLLFKSFKIGVMGVKHSYENYINIIKQEVNLNDQRI